MVKVRGTGENPPYWPFDVEVEAVEEAFVATGAFELDADFVLGMMAMRLI
jgi:hypothetical protein